jgi:hypothetical protein
MFFTLDKTIWRALSETVGSVDDGGGDKNPDERSFVKSSIKWPSSAQGRREPNKCKVKNHYPTNDQERMAYRNDVEPP